MIGAAALAAHRYVRATKDVDLATSVSPGTHLRPLEHALHEMGLRAKLEMPDADDQLGGVLKVWEAEAEDEDGDPLHPVEVVNFQNPHRPTKNPGWAAIANAQPLDDIDGLRYATIPDLVALKLYAGSRRDHADVVELLARNRDTDLQKVRAAAGPFDRDNILETLIAEAVASP